MPRWQRLAGVTEKARQVQTKRIHGNLAVVLLVTMKDIYFYSSMSTCVSGTGVGAVGLLVQPAHLTSSAGKKGEVKINSSMNTEMNKYFIS